jgi:hypothetical protein
MSCLPVVIQHSTLTIQNYLKGGLSRYPFQAAAFLRIFVRRSVALFRRPTLPTKNKRKKYHRFPLLSGPQYAKWLWWLGSFFKG